MKHDHRKIPIPVWMKKLPLDKRGYPITYTTTISKGVPYFEIVDEGARQTAVKKGLCSLCGKGLVKNKALVGGPLSAFHDGGAYLDVPMHIECARYALQVCPYLAVPKYKKEANAEKLSAKVGGVVGVNTMLPGRPELFVLVVCQKVELIMHKNFPTLVKYARAGKPYKWVEFWRDGQRLDYDEGMTLTKEILEAQLEQDLFEAFTPKKFEGLP